MFAKKEDEGLRGGDIWKFNQQCVDALYRLTQASGEDISLSLALCMANVIGQTVTESVLRKAPLDANFLEGLLDKLGANTRQQCAGLNKDAVHNIDTIDNFLAACEGEIKSIYNTLRKERGKSSSGRTL